MSRERFIRHPEDVDRGVDQPGLRIERLWAVINVDATGAEGITGIYTPEGTFPMVVSTKAGADKIWKRAKGIHEQYGRTLRLVCFSVREVLEERSGVTKNAGGSSEPGGDR